MGNSKIGSILIFFALIIISISIFFIIIFFMYDEYFKIRNKVDLYFETQPIFTIPVSVSAYSPSADETDNDPYINAANQIVKVGSCAVSRDLIEILQLNFGDLIILKGVGTYEYLDVMGPQQKRKVDIFFKKKQKAEDFGVLENINMTIIRRK